MSRKTWLTIAVASLSIVAGRSSPALAGSEVELVAASGIPLRVALDETMSLTRVGQTVHATLVEPLYVYDRLVLPTGTRVTGHVATLDDPPRLARLRAWSSGDFTPKRHATIEFDAVIKDGDTIALRALGLNGTPNVRRQVAADSKPGAVEDTTENGVGARARAEIRQRAHDAVASAKQRASDTIAAIKGPDKKERVKLWLVDQLPYHRQYLSKGTVYDARLEAPVTFGRVEQVAVAAPGTLPAPSSVMRARLTLTLDSSKTTRGATVEAVVIEPVFSADHELILPEGTRLTGEVTVAKPARSFHRNGQLRFLFESVKPPQGDSATLLASLHSVDVSANDHIAVDEEGGAAVSDSKTRFIAPGLAVLALAGASDNGTHVLDADDPGFGTGVTVRQGSSHLGSRSLGGFLGFGLIGTALARVSYPVGLAFAVLGVVQTTYTNILGKGQDVRFLEDTPIELRLAPGVSPAQ